MGGIGGFGFVQEERTGGRRLRLSGLEDFLGRLIVNVSVWLFIALIITTILPFLTVLSILRSHL